LTAKGVLATLTLQNKQQRVNCNWQIFETRSCQYNIGAILSPMGHGKDLIAEITCHFESGIVFILLYDNE